MVTFFYIDIPFLDCYLSSFMETEIDLGRKSNAFLKILYHQNVGCAPMVFFVALESN